MDMEEIHRREFTLKENLQEVIDKSYSKYQVDVHSQEIFSKGFIAGIKHERDRKIVDMEGIAKEIEGVILFINSCETQRLEQIMRNWSEQIRKGVKKE